MFGTFRNRRSFAFRLTRSVIIYSALTLSVIVALSLVALAAGAYTERCQGSWYGPGFYGQQTASGEIYTGEAGTAAHPWLPFGTIVHVVNLATGAEGDLRITDRGPYAAGRCIDVSAGSRYLVSGSVANVVVSTSSQASASASASASAAPAQSSRSAGAGASSATASRTTGSNGPRYTRRSHPKSDGVYVVRPSDWRGACSVAAKLGVSCDYLLENNGLGYYDVIYVGDKLYY